MPCTYFFICQSIIKTKTASIIVKATNVHWHEGQISPEEREQLLGQKGSVLWLTGLSGSGKSTIARKLEYDLIQEGKLAYVLDGDNIRHGLNQDLGFSPQDREENIRRIAEVSRLFQDMGAIVITAFISPYQKDRDIARSLVPQGRFWEVFVQAPVSVCEERDPKGLYKKARAGEIPEFTGISAPYEEPQKPELMIPTDEMSLEQAVSEIIKKLKSQNLI